MARAPAAHRKAEYTTATAPLAKANSLDRLQGESIHELSAALTTAFNELHGVTRDEVERIAAAVVVLT